MRRGRSATQHCQDIALAAQVLNQQVEETIDHKSQRSDADDLPRTNPARAQSSLPAAARRAKWLMRWHRAAAYVSQEHLHHKDAHNIALPVRLVIIFELQQNRIRRKHSREQRRTGAQEKQLSWQRSA